MSVKKTKKTKGNEKQKRFSFFSDMDQDKKSNLLKCAGAVVMVFALLTLLSTTSYLFTWEADMSLLSQPDMMGKEIEVNNLGGKLGYRWSHFLMAECFGFGSFALVFLLGQVDGCGRLFVEGVDLALCIGVPFLITSQDDLHYNKRSLCVFTCSCLHIPLFRS